MDPDYNSWKTCDGPSRDGPDIFRCAVNPTDGSGLVMRWNGKKGSWVEGGTLGDIWDARLMSDEELAAREIPNPK
jgi:hypothetical protein